jgi:hypothetical protein
MFRLVVLALCSLMLAMPAKAREGGSIVGWISSLDRMYDKIILDDGETFLAPPYINFEMLSSGSRVLLVFVSGPSGKTAVEVVPAPKIELPKQRAGAV